MSEAKLNNEVHSANGWFQIAVASDGTTASIKKIVRHSGDGKPVKSADILKKLKELKVVYGIDNEAINALLESVEEHEIPEKPVIIAKGDVEHGQNANIHWNIEGITDSDKSFLVVPGLAICTKRLSTQGKKGKNVFGKPANPRPGFDQQLNHGEGVCYRHENDDEVIYEATYAGMLSYTDRTLSVSSGLHVSEDRLQVRMDLYNGDVYGMNRGLVEEDILQTLASANIEYGINNERIKQELEHAKLSSDIVSNVLLVEGTAPVKGGDDVLEWHVNLGAKEINEYAVIPEQKIATVSTESKPEPGIDVYGDELAAPEGHRLALRCGKGVTKTEQDDAVEYYADSLGIVHFESDVISVKSGVNISKDKMQAKMSLLRPHKEGSENDILFTHVVQTLNLDDIVYGIKNDAIKLILDNINKTHESKIDLLVAEGKPVINGVNTRVEYDKKLFNEGKLLEDGRIDFHEKSYPWNVKEGDIVGKLIRGQRAEDGTNVYGETVLASVTEYSDPILEGVELEADGSLRITEPGVLLVNGINFKVSDNLQIDGDVNQKTGNIHCDKTVNVKGYVEPGFILETKGDAIIQENVENATVNAEGNIVIKSGIRGTQSKIICHGDLSASFAENAELNAKGDIHIKNNVINCHSVCNGIMHIGDPHSRKSGVAGNITHAYKGIESAVIGSDSFIKTIIIGGAGIETTKQLLDVAEEIKNIKVVLEDLERVYAHYCKNPKSQEEQNALLLKLEETREIKNSELDELNSDTEQLQNIVESSKDAKIIVHKRIYPGVKIILSNKTYEVKEERGAGIFCIEDEKVIFVPK